MVYGGVSPSSPMTLPQGFAELELVMGYCRLFRIMGVLQTLETELNFCAIEKGVYNLNLLGSIGEI